MWTANGGRPLPFKFDWVEGTITPIDTNNELLSRFVSTHIKQTMWPCYRDWEEVPIHFKEQLFNVVEVIKLNMVHL